MGHITEREDAPSVKFNRYLGILVSVGMLLAQGAGLVWFLAVEDARISRNTDTLAIMQARNLPSRVQTLEDGALVTQRDIAQLQNENRQINAGLESQSNGIATITAKLDFVIGQLFPAGVGRAGRHTP